ncbi:hypothetical protein R1sor_016438 [Riccia sorocarpa]|uniref:Uncharacterized protein n=1 Tax=Riccia sorocarpa TaxID=122646 RepID=A0ABD3HJ08_9MARC
MITNSDNNYHSLVVVLQPQFCKKHNKDDWREDFPSTWRFDCLGGNHSLAARYRITITHPGSYDELLMVNCIVYIGLTKSEAALIAHDDNADAQIRRRYTFPQQIEYYHKQWLERGDEETSDLRRRLTLETQVIGPAQTIASKMLSTEAYFDIAFKSGALWDATHAVFQKYDQKEGTGKRGKKGDGEGQINLNFIRSMTGISNERKTSILLRLLDGTIKIEDVKLEADASKVNDVMAGCFCKQVGVASWDEAKEKLPEYANKRRLNQFFNLFKDVVPAEQLLALLAPGGPSDSVQDPASGSSEVFPVAAGPSDPVQDPASGISAELHDRPVDDSSESRASVPDSLAA